MHKAYFNLRKDSRTSNIDFDDDDVHTKDIHCSEIKYRLKKLVNKIIDESITSNEAEYFMAHCKEVEIGSLYRPKTKEELSNLVNNCIMHLNYDYDLNWIDVSRITDMSNLFHESIFDGDISKWNVSNVENMENMFCNSKFTGDISRWDVSRVKNMEKMFMLSKFDGDLRNWDITNVETMEAMFAYSNYDQNLSTWNVDGKITTDMFYDCSIMDKFKPKKTNISESAFNLRRDSRTSNIDFDNAEVTVENIKQQKSDFINNCIDDIINETYTEKQIQKLAKYLKAYDEPIYAVPDALTLEKIIMALCVRCAGYVYDLNWLDTGKITYMKDLFHGINYNPDISRWDVSNVTNMQGMFASNDLFNCDISKWDVRKVIDMKYMFLKAYNFNLPIGKWKTESLELVESMFLDAKKFNQDISDWDISKIKDMSYMFYGAKKFNQDLSNWDISKVKIMTGMFMDAYSLTKRPDWDIPEKTAKQLIFDNAGCGLNESTANFNLQSADFNLQKNNAVRPDIFTDDEADTEIYKYVQDKQLLPIFEKVRSDIELTDNEINYWNLHIESNPSFYVVRTYEELQSIIVQFMLVFGTEMNLNWLNTKRMTTLQYLFKDSKFNGDISLWDTHSVTCLDGIFADSEFNGDISNWDVSNVHTMISAFYNSKFNGDLSKWDVSAVTDMSAMFANSKFNRDISMWDVSCVTDMKNMFYLAAFNQPINNWNVNNVTNMMQMFYHSAFNQNISDWLLNKLVNINDAFDFIELNNKPNIDFIMFESASNFQLSNRKVKKDEFNKDEICTKEIAISLKSIRIKKLIKSLFNGCNLNDENKQFIIENIDEYKYTVNSREELKQLIEVYIMAFGNKCNLNWIDTRLIKDMSNLFSNSEFNGDISQWDISHVEDMNSMFAFSKFDGDISGWDVSNVTDMGSMFGGSEFNSDISSWDVSSVINMSLMFAYSEFNGNISGWDITNLKNAKGMFYASSVPENYRPKLSINESAFNLQRDSKTSDIDFDNDEVPIEDIQHSETKYKLLEIIKKIENISLDKIDSLSDDDAFFFSMHSHEFDNEPLYQATSKDELKSFIQKCMIALGDSCSLNWIDVSKMTDMSELFMYAIFNGDISNWDVSHVKNMSAMFAYSKFNGNLSRWDVSNVEDMSYMFLDNRSFDGNVSKWDVSNVTSMQAMFNEAKSFNQPLNDWDVHNVKNMNAMFAYTDNFNQDLNDWDVSNVEDMCYMFTSSKFNKPLDSWDVSSATKLAGIFYQSAFDQDISNWTINENLKDNADLAFVNMSQKNRPNGF